MSAGTITSRQIVEQYLARIDAYDQRGPTINAFIALNPQALDEAAALDAERKAGRTRGPLHGIPIAIKDNYVTADLPTTGGSLALQEFEAGRDAFVVKKLRDAGAVIIGKTNLHELAYGITTISSMGGQTRNPYDPTRNPGGSSGGTGAAVAANFARRRHGQRHVRIDPHSRRAQQPLRPARDARPVQPRRASCRSRTRRTSADRWRGASPTWR